MPRSRSLARPRDPRPVHQPAQRRARRLPDRTRTGAQRCSRRRRHAPHHADRARVSARDHPGGTRPRHHLPAQLPLPRRSAREPAGDLRAAQRDHPWPPRRPLAWSETRRVHPPRPRRGRLRDRRPRAHRARAHAISTRSLPTPSPGRADATTVCGHPTRPRLASSEPLRAFSPAGLLVIAAAGVGGHRLQNQRRQPVLLAGATPAVPRRNLPARSIALAFDLARRA